MGRGGGWEAQGGGGGKCIHTADLLVCTVETDITVNQLHSKGEGIVMSICFHYSGIRDHFSLERGYVPSKNPIGLAVLNLKVVQDVRRTRVSELSVISSEERGFKNQYHQFQACSL